MNNNIIIRYLSRIKCIFIYFFITSFKPFFNLVVKHDNIWLIGENFGNLQKDNGYHLFRYCHKEDIVAFFITSKHCINNDSFLSHNKNVVCYGSFKHILLFIFSDVNLYTHTFRDILYHSIFKLQSSNKKLVYLKHGVTGFKCFNNDYIKNNYLHNLVISVSEKEKEIISSNLGVNRDNVKITGFARWDNLIDSSHSNHRFKISYMPTWRDWIKSDQDFLTSNYNAVIKDLITNPCFLDLIKRHDIEFKLYQHVRMKQFSSRIESSIDEIEIIKNDTQNIQQMISNSNLFITDYSSVSWDFLYLKKPVIFYQFDVEEYLDKRGSYLNFEHDLFGHKTNTVEELITYIDSYLTNGLTTDPLKFKNPFKYSDQNNCKRIVNEINAIPKILSCAP